MSTCPTIRSSTCCPSDNADIYGYNVGDNATPPPPTVVCPVDFNGWTTDGEYEIPDFTESIEVCAFCQEREDLIITQEPPAGTIVTAQGNVTILITVTDTYGQIVTCSFIITVNDPPGTDTDNQTPTFPPWIYTPFLFVYWSANDTLCSPDIVDEGSPCFRRRDLSEFFGNTSPRILTNGGGAGYSTVETPLDGFPSSPGPIFNRGSFASNNDATGYLYRADDTALRLVGISFTVAAFFKLTAIDAMESWQVAGKFSTLGYRIIVRRPDTSTIYTVTAEIDNGSDLLTVPAQPFALGDWIWVVMVFDATAGQLRLYVDGVPRGTDTIAGFALTGEASQFRIGSGTSGGTDVLACWPLDNTAWEDSVGGRHLTSSGIPTSVAGKISNALRGDWVGRAEYPDDAALRLLGTDFSFRFWLRSNGGGEMAAVRKDGSYQFGVNLSGPNMVASFRAGASFAAQNSATTLTLLTWHHIVWTYKSSTQTLKLYINGVLDTTFAGVSIVSAANPFQVSYSIIESDAFISVDELAIFTEELSGAEVTADYNGGTGTSCPSVASTANVYTDEIGIWLQAWSDARVAEQYAIMEPYLT